MLYFTYLVKQLRKESEELQLPATVSDVRSLIEWLRKRDPNLPTCFGREASRSPSTNSSLNLLPASTTVTKSH